MKLSMSLLERYLRRYRMESNIINDSMELRGVRFLSDQRISLSSEYVYLGRADSYFSDDKYANAWLIASGQSHILCYDCDHEELLNDLLAAFEYYNAWEQQLRELVSGGATVQDIMDVLSLVLDLPAQVVDLNGKIIGSCHMTEHRSIPGIAYMIEKKMVPTEALHMPLLTQDGKPLRDILNVPSRVYAQDYSECAVVMYLCQNDEPLAYIQFCETEYTTSPLPLQLQSIIAPYLLKTVEFEGIDSVVYSNHTILSRLLSGEEVAEQALEKFCRSTKMAAPWMVLVIRSLTVQNYTQRSLLIQELNSARIPCFALEHERNVLVLLEESGYGAIFRELQARINLQNIAIGVSMSVQTLTDFPVAYRQALFALDHGQQAGVYACRDYALQYLVDGIRNERLASELIHPGIRALEQYDKEHNAELLKTLMVYMQEDRNKVETAERLHTHRHTIKYRLDRIDQLTGIDFNDWEERNYLSISLLLYGAGY